MNKINIRGFTLIELLVVVAILTILAVVIQASVKPALRLAQARDARRAEDINQILTAIHSCASDKKDTNGLPICLGTYVPGETYEIVSGNVTTGCNAVCTTATTAGHCLTLNTTLSDYFVSLPKDPNNAVPGHTGYAITITSGGMTILDACAAETGILKVSR